MISKKIGIRYLSRYWNLRFKEHSKLYVDHFSINDETTDIVAGSDVLKFSMKTNNALQILAGKNQIPILKNFQEITFYYPIDSKEKIIDIKFIGLKQKETFHVHIARTIDELTHMKDHIERNNSKQKSFMVFMSATDDLLMQLSSKNIIFNYEQ